jgi:hypothetical protein
MALSTESTKGKCEKCGVIKTKREMLHHLSECYFNSDKSETILLFIECPYRKQYWMHVAIQKDAKIETLDALLRDTWLECCGHLSQFLVGEKRYVSYSNDLGSDDKMMSKTKASAIFESHTTISYEYDFGTTTELSIKVAGMVRMKIDKTGSEILSINEVPLAICDRCGGKAEFINSCSSDETYCQKCSEKLDEDDRQMLLPIVNSPRTGACGYTGEAVLEKDW